ncbi:MAG: DUF3788 domain-containing protein [Methanobrevibacter sp.]|jgi:hypothetical protein|nr:DUF3788 domain-containing protein [Candidatus Methanoflexus mossambicus]
MNEKKRLTEKSHQPTEDFIQLFLGDDAWQWLIHFEKMLQERYDLNREMKFPFGNEYGWSFRYAHKKSLLLYVFFEENGFCCTISINDKGASQVDTILDDLLPKTQDIWKNRYPCGDFGGWIHYSVELDDELSDIIQLVGIKVKPKK